jgi:hypothetical protein
MNRRELIKLGTGAMCNLPAVAAGLAEAANTSTVAHPDTNLLIEQWGTYELILHGPSGGNPFLDVHVIGRFRIDHRTIDVPGFYDGDGIYRIRYMPDSPGEWTCETRSNSPSLDGKAARFTCTPTTRGNHGPVQVTDRYHFEHADGTPFFPFGTTCYAWAFMGSPYEEETIDILRTAPFNKVRMCLLPKPLGRSLFALPFPRSATGINDFSRFNPEYFQHIEQRVQDLLRLNIQADLILFHPYDEWGYKSMPPEVNDRYLRYVVARFSAYRNIWWSLANEYDFIRSKTTADWDHYFRIVQESDPSSHLRSIHNGAVVYDNSKPWVTHASLQSFAFDKTAEWRSAWNKPIIFDEMQYEGDIPSRWGNLSPEEMTRRFWMAVISGAYASHGETYMSNADQPVWSNGRLLRGTSPARIGFLRNLLEGSTDVGLNQQVDSYYYSANQPGQLYLWYFDYHRPAQYDFPLPDDTTFTAEWIDPWNMSVHSIPGKHRGKTTIKLPHEPYMAVRFKKVTQE